jgi:hypothetical protein
MRTAIFLLGLLLSSPVQASDWLYTKAVDPENGRDAHFYFGAPDGEGPLFGFVCLPARPFAGLAVHLSKQPVSGEYVTTVRVNHNRPEKIRMVASGIDGMIVSRSIDVIHRKTREIGAGGFALVTVEKNGKKLGTAIYSLATMDHFKEFKSRCGPVIG